MQVPRKMAMASNALLDLFDINRRITADGVVTIDELRQQRAAERKAESAFEQADAGIGLVMAAMKGGPESRSYRDLKQEYERIWGDLGYTDPRPANVVPLNAKKHSNRGNGPSAA